MPNVGFLLSGMEKEYFDDIQGVVRAAGKVPVKIMLELPLLNEAQKERAVALSIEAGVLYLKNASGGAVGIATPEDMRFLRRLAPSQVRVKASGGIKTAQQVRELLEAGADLVGTSSGVQIMRQALNGTEVPVLSALSQATPRAKPRPGMRLPDPVIIWLVSANDVVHAAKSDNDTRAGGSDFSGPRVRVRASANSPGQANPPKPQNRI